MEVSNCLKSRHFIQLPESSSIETKMNFTNCLNSPQFAQYEITSFWWLAWKPWNSESELPGFTSNGIWIQIRSYLVSHIMNMSLSFIIHHQIRVSIYDDAHIQMWSIRSICESLRDERAKRWASESERWARRREEVKEKCKFILHTFAAKCLNSPQFSTISLFSGISYYI